MTLTSATSTTQAVVHHHLERFVALDLQGVLADYAPDAVMIVPTGVLRGVQEITPLFQNLLAEFAHAIFAACGAYQLTGCHARRAPRGEVRLYPDGHFDIYVAEPGDRASRTSGSGICTVDLLLARGEH